jgi:hypothetical protein
MIGLQMKKVFRHFHSKTKPCHQVLAKTGFSPGFAGETAAMLVMDTTGGEWCPPVAVRYDGLAPTPV